MRLATVASVGRDAQCDVVVSVDGQTWHKIVAEGERSWAKSLKGIITYSGKQDLNRLASDDLPTEKDAVDSNSLQFLTPLRHIEKLICIGKNYADHAAEMGGKPPEIPVVFSKFPSCLIGNGQEVVLPNISSQVDYEAELVVVIGREGKNIARSEALSHVFGYTIGNDISARDWQKGRPGGQWLMGKAFDTFAPIGPWIVTADEITDPQNLQLSLTLNGQQMQNANTSQMIFPIDYLIEHVSKFFTLKPGDLIFTGTPSGVGAGRTPPVFLKAGDQMIVEIENIGQLKNPVIASS